MMTQKEWSLKTEKEYREFAFEIGKNITIRTYHNGTSSDTTRPSTDAEHIQIANICMSGMLAYGKREDADLQSILDVCEFMGQKIDFTFTNEAERQVDSRVNAYDTIYIPLQKVMGKWS